MANNKFTHKRTGKKIAPPGRPFYKTLSQGVEITDYTVEQGEFAPLLFVCFFIITIFSSALCLYRFGGMNMHYNAQMKELQEVKDALADSSEEYESEIAEEIIPDDTLPDDYGQ